jgi:hypothetical protein
MKILFNNFVHKFSLQTSVDGFTRSRANLAVRWINKRFARVSAKAHLTLPKELKEILVGSLLGDLSCERPNPRCNTRMQFKQSTKNREYIEHLYLLFSAFCGSTPLVMSSFDSRPSKMKNYFAIKFQTLSLPCFNVYREMFYNSAGVKIIPDNLEELLTASPARGDAALRCARAARGLKNQSLRDHEY